MQGAVDPEGQQTQYAFQWGPTAGYGHETTLTSAGSGTTLSAVSAPLSGLNSGSTYHFRTIAMSAAGTSVGPDQTFTTSGKAPAPSASPQASTAAATNVAGSSATLTGTVNPKGQATSYYFEYGTTVNYGFETPAVSGGSGTSNESVTAKVTGLTTATAYHFRLVAVNPGGTALGTDQTLTTLAPPAVATLTPSSVNASSAVLNGTVDPESQATTFYFELGTTAAYGLETEPISAGSGGATAAVNRDVTGLAADTTYHYRVVAQNSSGTSYGADQTVTTSATPLTQSRIGVLGRMGFVSRSGWVGVVIGCFGGQTECSGRITLKYKNEIVGERRFTVSPKNGGFENVRLDTRARRMLDQRYPNGLAVRAYVVGAAGQSVSTALTLARWN